MKSVGEVMAIGRSSRKRLLKGVRALDTARKLGRRRSSRRSHQRLVTPHPNAFLTCAMPAPGSHGQAVGQVTSIDPWFLYQLKEINDMQLELEKHPMESIPRSAARGQAHGFLDGRLAGSGGSTAREHRKKFASAQEARHCADLQASRHLCAEFESYTPYLYSTYEEEDEATPPRRRK